MRHLLNRGDCTYKSEFTEQRRNTLSELQKSAPQRKIIVRITAAYAIKGLDALHHLGSLKII